MTRQEQKKNQLVAKVDAQESAEKLALIAEEKRRVESALAQAETDKETSRMQGELQETQQNTGLLNRLTYCRLVTYQVHPCHSITHLIAHSLTNPPITPTLSFTHPPYQHAIPVIPVLPSGNRGSSICSGASTSHFQHVPRRYFRQAVLS